VQIIDLYAKLEKIFITTNMKKILQQIALLITISSFFIIGTNAQCLPDASINSSGVFPASLPAATPNVGYSQVLQFYITKDTLINYLGQNIKANIDSLFIIGVKGMPSGFTYACHNTNCGIKGGSNGCVTITGTATEAMANTNYPLVVMIKIKGTANTILGPISQNINDSNSKYAIYVQGLSSVNELTNINAISLYPNPAKDKLELNVSQNLFQNADGIIMDINGREISRTVINKTKTEIDISILSKGIYFMKYINENGLVKISKFIKE
jgi:hypothetical protein